MKLKKLGWGGAMALSSLLALSTVAQAQDKKDDKPAATPAAPAPAAPGAPAVRPAPGPRPDMRAARVDARLKGMSQMLALTDDQKAKIKPLLEDEFKQYEELQQDKALAPEERMKKFREVRESMQAKIKPILTAEQQQKLESRQRPPQRKPAVPGAPAPAPAK